MSDTFVGPFAHHNFVRHRRADIGVLETLQGIPERAAVGAAAAQGRRTTVGAGTTLSTAHLDRHPAPDALQHAAEAMATGMIG